MKLFVYSFILFCFSLTLDARQDKTDKKEHHFQHLCRRSPRKSHNNSTPTSDDFGYPVSCYS